MTIRELVIDALECIISSGNAGMRDNCATCIYPGGGDCLASALRDALALLKAQVPRMMTLEEALSADECWIEGRNGACGYGDALLTDDAERVEFYRPHTISTLDFYSYGKDWRCWSYKPTDEQRKAVAWE